MSERELERVQLLMNMSRFAEAEREVRGVLAREPGSAWAQALLATCLLHQDKKEEALREARAAVGLDPELSYTHYALARTLAVCEQEEPARLEVMEAIRLDPQDSDYRGLLAALHLSKERWAEALEAAEKGLALDPEHPWCTELRARALVRLGRTSEAGAVLEARLKTDPEDAGAHTARGMLHLQCGRFPEALASFQEALRLDPTSESARYGMLEALKARYRLYGLFLRYSQWMARLSDGQRWGFVIGAYLVYRLLGDLAESRPDLRPFVRPLLWAYLAFVVFSWTTAPLGDLFLSLTRFGRLSLDQDQLRGARCVGACLLAALVFLALGLVWAPFPLAAAAGAGVLILPMAATWSRPPGPRLVLGAITAGLVLLGLSALAAHLTAAFAAPPLQKELENLAGFQALGFFVGVGLVTFLGNFVGLLKPRLPLGKEEELAERGRWRLLAGLALAVGATGLLLVLQLLAKDVSPVVLVQLGLGAGLGWAIHQGQGWARWVGAAGFAGSSGLLALAILAERSLTAAWLLLPLGLLHGAFAAWLVLSPSLRGYLAWKRRARPT